MKNILFEFQTKEKYISSEKLVCFQLAVFTADSTLINPLLILNILLINLKLLKHFIITY